MQLSRNTSPVPGRRSSCASASEAAKGHNDGPLLYSEDKDEDEDLKQMGPDEDHDTISGLSEPTPCALIHSVGGHRVEVACGIVYPRQFELHTVPIQAECAVVKVELVAEWPKLVLPFPPNDEISKLGEAVLQRIQWPRIDIVVRSKQVSSQTVAKAITKSASDASKLPTKESESAGAPKSATKSVPITAAAKSATITAVAPNDAPITTAPKSAPNCVENIAASADKIVAANSRTQKGSKKQEPIKRSKEPAGKKQPKKKGAASPWTQENPKYRYGRPLLTAAELENAGHAITSLHNYYLQCCAEKKKYIVASYKRGHLLREAEDECFLLCFNDLYDLFNLDALDVSLLHSFTLSMIMETKAKSVPVGFLDPQMMSLSTMNQDRSYVVDYVTKALQKCARKRLIMFAHNTVGHWILVVIIPKWRKALYFDSQRSKARDHSVLKQALDEAFISYCTLKKMDTSTSLQHVTKFQCHQQPPGHACGFYVIHHMVKAMELLSMQGDPEEFEVMTNTLGINDLQAIREKICSFILDQVISAKGEFHCRNPGPNQI